MTLENIKQAIDKLSPDDREEIWQYIIQRQISGMY